MKYRYARRSLAASILLALVAAVAACGSSKAAGSSTSSATAANSSVGSLTVGVPSIATLTAVLFIAKAEGYFQKYHVNVNIETAGATAGTEVAAGRLDVTQLGTTGAFAPAASGRQTSIIYWLAGNATSAVSVRTQSPLKPADNALDSLMELSGKRVAVQGSGTSSSGNASAFSKYIVSRGGKPMQIINLPTLDAINAQLLSGQIDAAVGLPDYVAPAIAAGKARILVSASDPSIIKLSGGSTAAISLFGLKSNLQKKATTVTAFLAAVRAGLAFLNSHTVEQVANVLHGQSYFADQSVAAIEATYKLDVPFDSPDGGFISSATWTRSLEAFKAWGLNLNVDDPEFSYDSIVDMSYWNGATKLLGG
jgi:ABC-type nitrate/sulfonate/bicarbonate transport system substrate-binding protein